MLESGLEARFNSLELNIRKGAAIVRHRRKTLAYVGWRRQGDPQKEAAHFGNHDRLLHWMRWLARVH